MSIDLIGPDGTPWELDNEDPKALDEALRQGFKRPVAPQEKSTLEELGSGLAAGVQGAVEGVTGGALGATLGLAAAKDKYGFSDPIARQGLKTARTLKEENPITSGVGELAGAVVSPINAVAPLVEGQRAGTVVGRIGQKALGNAAVGSLYGAGQAVSDAALGDQQLNAEKILASGGLGAVLGGVGGGIFGAVEEGASGILPKVSKLVGGGNSTLEDFANDRWLKASGGIQNEIKKIPLAERPAVADALRSHLVEPGKTLPKSLDEALASIEGEQSTAAQKVISESGITDAGGLSPTQNQEDALASIARAHEAHGKRMGAVMDTADELGASPVYSDIAARIRNFERGLNPAERDIADGPLKDIKRYISKMAAGDQSFGKLNDLKSTLQKDINWISDGSVKAGLKKQIVGVLRDEIDTQLGPQVGGDLAEEWLAAKKEFGALSRAEDALGRKTSTGMDAIRALAENSETASPTMPRLSALEHASKLVRRGVDRELGNRWLSASDYLTGIGTGVATGGPLGALSGLATSVAHKFMREKGAAVIAQLADKLAASPALATTAQSFAKSIPLLAPKMGGFGETLVRAAAVSPANALATHMVMAQADPSYSSTAQLAGLQPEEPAQHNAALGRASELATVAAALKSHDDALSRHIGLMLSGNKEMPSQHVMSSQDFGTKRLRSDDAVEKRAAEIRKLAANPSEIVDRVANNAGRFSDIASGISGALTDRAHAAVQYLAQSISEPPKAGPLAPNWKMTEAEAFDFTQRLEIVQSPMSALRHAAAGTLTPVQAEAFQAVLPTVARQIADEAIQRAMTRDVPYTSRLMVSMLTGIDLDGTLNPESIFANQVAIKQEKSQPGKPADSGSDKLTLASRTALPSQRREMETEA
jgi:hypothetical protein